jgi:hypothetical protein
MKKVHFTKRQLYISVCTLVVTLLLGVANTAKAQQKVNDGSVAATAINVNAIAEYQTNKRGILLPRVALSATNLAAPLTAHVEGMTVYNTAYAGTAPNDVTPGWYYNDGTKWVRLQSNNISSNVFTSGPPTGTGSTNTIYTDTLSGSPTQGQQYIWNGSTYVSYTAPPSTEWTYPLSSTDAGSDKTSRINRNHEVGVTLSPGTPFGQFRMIGPNPGASSTASFLRNDGDATYLLLTNPGDYWGAFNSLRPFYVHNSTGNVKFCYTESSPGVPLLKGVNITHATGNVGIGVINPVQKLEVDGSILTATGNMSNFGGLGFNRDASTGAIFDATAKAYQFTRIAGAGLFLQRYSEAGANENGAQIVFTDANLVGINTPGPTATLSVNGTANNSTGAWGVFSDARIKTVDAAFKDGLSVIKNINPVKFHYNADAPFAADGQQIGVVAQELEKIAPYMVSQMGYKDIKDLREVNNQAYTFLLINAVKELSQQVEALKAEVDVLKASHK